MSSQSPASQDSGPIVTSIKEITYLEKKISNLRQIWNVLKAKEVEFKDLHKQFDHVITEDENLPRGAVNFDDISQSYMQMKLQRSNSYAEIEKEAEILGETITQLETRLLLKKEELERAKNEKHETESGGFINKDMSISDVTLMMKESISQTELPSNSDDENDPRETIKLGKVNKRLRKELRKISEEKSQLETLINTLKKQKEELLIVNHEWDAQYHLLKEDKDRVIESLQRKLQSSPQNEVLVGKSDSESSSHAEEQRIDRLVKEKDDLGKQLNELRAKQAKADSLWISAKKMITEEREARLDATKNTMVAQEKAKDLEEELARTKAQGLILKDEIERLIAEGKKTPVAATAVVLPQEQIEQIEMLKHQVRTYVDDFTNERSDRERIQVEKERLSEELKASENEITFLNEQLRAYKDDFKKERIEKERIQRQLRDRTTLLTKEPWYYSPPNDYNSPRATPYDRNYRGQPALSPREIQELAFRQNPAKVNEGNAAGGYDVIDGPSTTYDCPLCARKFPIHNRRAFEDHVNRCT